MQKESASHAEQTPRRLTARQRRRANIERFKASQPLPLPGHEAIRHGTGSAQWNRYLASLPPTERAERVKAMRRAAWLADAHLTSWPAVSDNPRYPESRR